MKLPQLILVKCSNPECNHEWHYKGDKKRATCGICHRKTNVEKNSRLVRKNARYFLTDEDGKKHEFSANRPHYYKNGRLCRFDHKIGL